MYSSFLQFLRELLEIDGDLKTAVGLRSRRTISIHDGNVPVCNNLFGLSTGESSVLNIFLTIIRDFDMSTSSIMSVEDITGIVVIDEIDTHMHSNLQFRILPKLIQSFPRVQFIVTNHSPLFLLGLQNALGKDNFNVIELPSGKEISVERFSEFKKAYDYFRSTATHDNEVKSAISASQKPILFVEGETDIKYIRHAAQLLGYCELVEGYTIFDATGYGGLDQIWKHYNTKLGDAIQQDVILLYDCDKNHPAMTKGRVHRRTIPQTDSCIKSGIENLISADKIQSLRSIHVRYFDIIESHRIRSRGEDIEIPESISVNRQEKQNLCNDLLQTVDKGVFSNFESVFSILREMG